MCHGRTGKEIAMDTERSSNKSAINAIWKLRSSIDKEEAVAPKNPNDQFKLVSAVFRRESSKFCCIIFVQKQLLYFIYSDVNLLEFVPDLSVRGDG
jgi:hypothetical protein